MPTSMNTTTLPRTHVVPKGLTAKLRGPARTCLELAERARAAGALRCEVLLEVNLAWAGVMLGEFREALHHGTRSAEIAARIGAQRFEALGVAYAGIARANLEPEAVTPQDFDRALDLARASGLRFAGGAVYAAMISAERNPQRLKELLREADEEVLGLMINTMRPVFVHRALIAALGVGDHERAQRYADALRAPCAAEPSELGGLFADCARLRAAWSRGERGRKLRAELDVLRERLVRAELRPAVECFERTLRGDVAAH
jgi:hypothetical protein